MTRHAANGNGLVRLIREIRPQEVDKLAAQSRVRVRFDQLVATMVDLDLELTAHEKVVVERGSLRVRRASSPGLTARPFSAGSGDVADGVQFAVAGCRYPLCPSAAEPGLSTRSRTGCSEIVTMFSSPTGSTPRSRSGRPRIVLDLEKLRHANCGLGRFCRHLAEGILSLGEQSFDPVFFLPQTLPQETVRHFRAEGVEQIEVSPWRKETFASLYRPFLAPFQRRHRYDLWHVTNQTSKYLPLDPTVPVVLTIHDLNFLHDDRHKDRPGAAARKLADVQRKVDRATAIVTDSRYVADDVATHLRLGGKPVHVVAPGLPAPPPASAVAPAWAPRGRFLLSIGNCLPHKNFHALFGLIETLPGLALVIAGKRETPYGEHLAREVAARNLGDRVIFTGQVSDGDRQWLYERCEAFVFPSLTEGFGFPVLEAMQCGKPVFMSRRTSLPELGGSLGFYWDSFGVEHMAEVFRAGMATVAALPTFAAAARGRAAEFSWENATRGYLRVYRSILDAAAA